MGYYPVQQFFVIGGKSVAVFGRFLHGKAVLFGFDGKQAVVPLPAPAGVLYVEYHIIPHMHHFVHEAGNDFLQRSVQCARGDVDFTLAAVSGVPYVRRSVVSIRPRRRDDGDNGRFQFAVEPIGVDKVESLFQHSGQSGHFNNLLHE